MFIKETWTFTTLESHKANGFFITLLNFDFNLQVKLKTYSEQFFKNKMSFIQYHQCVSLCADIGITLAS